MGFFEKIGLTKKKETEFQPVVEEKIEEELRPLGEMTDIEKAEQKALIAEELYKIAETELSKHPDSGALQDKRTQAYMAWKTAEDRSNEIKRNQGR